MIKHTICLLIILGSSMVTQAQDIHFSQYNTSPLTLNPALTGFFTGDYRIAANFRSQWGSFTDTYRTFAASFELSVLKGKLKDDNLAFGVSFFNDKAGAVELSTNHLAFSVAYKKVLGFRVKHGLVVGLQGALINQKLNKEKLQFQSQYTGNAVDPFAGNVAIASPVWGGDLSAGVLWQIVPNRDVNVYIGAAYYHILQPSISMVSGSSYTLGAKYVGHIGAKFRLNELLNLLPSIAYYQQRSARQLNFGSYLQFLLKQNLSYQTSFSLGVWSRIAHTDFDAVILGARMDYQSFVLGLSYDINISSLRTVSSTRGAYEISLIYTGDFMTKGQRQLSMPCPQL